jgi:hypothetical protein
MAESIPEPKAMSLLELQSVVAAQINDAATYIDSNVAIERAEATKYYRGDKFGDEEEGRSQAISRDVHDTVNAITPSLMRIFFGPEQVVEFVPQGPEDVEMAKQATDYVNYIFTKDNPGFEITLAVIKDALIRKAGIVKWWWDESEEVRTVEYSGLSEDSLSMLMTDLEGAEKAELVESEQDEDGNLEVTIRLTRKRDRVVVQALPPEEFLIDRNARDIDEATFVAHRTMKTVSELVAMGYDEDDVKEQSEEGDELRFNLDRLSRNPYAQMFGVVPNLDPAGKLVLYVESYQKVDVDGDGIAELVKVCTIGPTFKIVYWEPVESRNFAAFICDPEPHTFFGYSIADKTMDIQRIKSALLRSALDSLSLTINPRATVNTRTGGPNILADAQNTEIGALIRTEDSSAYNVVVTPDVSPSAFEAMGYMDQVKESRTGMSRVSLGLDPQALQNTTATAAAGQFSQSQQHIELIARIFAETGWKRLFRGILKLVCENQRKERVINLTGDWVPMDPRGWKADMDVTANVALGGGTDGEKMVILGQIKETQEGIIQQYGPDNPLVGMEQYHHTLSQMLQIAGFKNPDAFFRDPAKEPPKPPAPPPEDPKMVEVQGRLQMEQARLQMAQQSDQAKLEQAQQKALGEYQLKQAQAESDHQLQLERMAMEADLKREQLAAEIDLKREQLAAELELKRQQMTAELALQVQTQDSSDIGEVNVGGDPG